MYMTTLLVLFIIKQPWIGLQVSLGAESICILYFLHLYPGFYSYTVEITTFRAEFAARF